MVSAMAMVIEDACEMRLEEESPVAEAGWLRRKLR
jgi:hypothetical protein